VFTTSQQAGCPDTLWEISTSNSAVIPVPGLNPPIVENGVRIVKPTDNTLHRGYVFYLKVSANGLYSSPHSDSVQWFGPYDLRVGCYTGASGSVIYTDSPSFVSNVNLFVGDSALNVYTFFMPTADRSWCHILTNSLRD
jgi:hypothetical protein